jgi:hypothetical protein
MCSGRREPRRSGPKPTRLPSQDSGLLGSPGRPGSPRPARLLPALASGEKHGYGMISSLPSHITIVIVMIETSLKPSKIPIGPATPGAGPTLALGLGGETLGRHPGRRSNPSFDITGSTGTSRASGSGGGIAMTTPI